MPRTRGRRGGRKKKNKNADLDSEEYVPPNFHQQKLKKPSADDEESEKRPKRKLRSSMDIYNRLLWDKTLSLTLEEVFIGYTDTQLGDQEMLLLDWLTIDKGGEIPMHHIFYFRYNTVFLWHRYQRLDRLFGSGNTIPTQMWSYIHSNPKLLSQINDTSVLLSYIDEENKSETEQTQRNGPVEIVYPDSYDKKAVVSSINDESKEGHSSKMATIHRPIKQPLASHFPRYPTTNDGFVQSFAIADSHTWIPMLEKYGCVVLKDVFTPQQCDASVNAIFDEAYHRRSEIVQSKNIGNAPMKVNLNNPLTWDSHNFPNPKWLFLFDRPAFHRQAFRNRCCDNVYSIFSTIYGGHRLNVTIDNWGVYRGTKNLNFYDPSNGQRLQTGVNRKDWRRSLNPHWDINPWRYNEYLEMGHYQRIYQGAIALNEHRSVDGVHLTLPGSAAYLKQWCADNDAKWNAYRHNIDLRDKIVRFMQPIPLRKGEMIVWDYGQLHGTTANESNRMRLVQYIRMFPSEHKYIKRDHYGSENILKKYKREIDIRKILGSEMNDRYALLLGLKYYS